MKDTHLKWSAVVAAMALLVPAGALAKRPEDKPAKGKAPKAKLVSANVKGPVVSNDGATLAVMVEKAGGHAKACVGRTLAFDVSSARVHGADSDGDGDVDAADVLVGHAVKVQGKLPRSKGRKAACAVPDGEVLIARQVHDRTAAEASAPVEEEAPES